MRLSLCMTGTLICNETILVYHLSYVISILLLRKVQGKWNSPPKPPGISTHHHHYTSGTAPSWLPLTSWLHRFYFSTLSVTASPYSASWLTMDWNPLFLAVSVLSCFCWRFSRFSSDPFDDSGFSTLAMFQMLTTGLSRQGQCQVDRWVQGEEE